MARDTLSEATSFVWWTRVYLILLLALPVYSGNGRCRYSRQTEDMPEKEFINRSFFWCYGFLVADPPGKVLQLYPTNYVKMFTKEIQKIYANFSGPDLYSTTMWSEVCKTRSTDVCERWRSCTLAAVKCCKDQLSAGSTNPGDAFCPRKWDGFGCWPDTPVGQEPRIDCPKYIGGKVILTETVGHTCTANRTWYHKGSVEWVDYKRCQEEECHLENVYMSIAVNIISIVALAPALMIFSSHVRLRVQQRIQIHMNFFVSFIINCIVTVLWDIVVTYDMLTSDETTTTMMYLNTAGCRLLTALQYYCTSTNFAWMFCEGFYLHNLLVNALEPLRTIVWSYIVGWVVPIIPVAVYSIVRHAYADNDCWAKPVNNYWWIISGPNLLCLCANLFFLIKILRVITHLHQHSEPDRRANYKRALKATLILVPLFGVHLAIQMYHLPSGHEGYCHYQKFIIFVRYSQGFFLSCIFCYFNGEVLTVLKEACRHCKPYRYIVERSQSTHMTSDGSSRTNSLLTQKTSVLSQKSRGSNASSRSARESTASRSSKGEGHIMRSSKTDRTGAYMAIQENLQEKPKTNSV